MTTTEETTPKALLSRAADIIEERGWYQGSWTGSGGCVCAWGALNVAFAEAAGMAPSHEDVKIPDESTIPKGLYATYERARRSVELEIGDHSISWWNDQDGRTKDEVTAVLRAAAEAGA